MYTFFIVLLIAASAVVWFLGKNTPKLLPVAYVLPMVALGLMILRGCGGVGNPNVPSGRTQANAAYQLGEQLGVTMANLLPDRGTVLAMHPTPRLPAYSRTHVRQMLQGMEKELRQRGFTLKAVEINEANAAGDPLADGYYIGPITIQRFADQHGDPVGVVLLGLQIGTAEEIEMAAIPLLVLTDTGDPGSSEWALANGHALAAVFENVGGARPPDRADSVRVQLPRFIIRTPSPD